MSPQGAIFLFFAGRIEAIKGNVDTVSGAGPPGLPDHRVDGPAGTFGEVGAVLKETVCWEEGGGGACGGRAGRQVEAPRECELRTPRDGHRGRSGGARR